MKCLNHFLCLNSSLIEVCSFILFISLGQHGSKIGERSLYCILQMYVLMTLEFCLTHKRLSWQWNAVSDLPCCFVAKQMGLQ